MSFDKKYPNSKDARQRLHVYHDSRDVDASCRCHGNCPTCEGNRRHAAQKQSEAFRDALKDAAGS